MTLLIARTLQRSCRSLGAGLAMSSSSASSLLNALLWLGLVLLPCSSGFSVCVFTDGPAGYASCTPAGLSASATGYDVEMFRKTASAMGWSEVEGSTAAISLSTATSPNSTYSFVCQPPSTARQSLLTTMANGTLPLATCAVAIGRVEQNGKLSFLGARFSQPWLKTPIVILVDTGSVVVKADPWSWTKPFAGGVWAALACNLLIVAVCLWLIERFQRPQVKVKVEKEELEHLKLNTYRTILAMFSQDIMPVHTTTSQLVVIAYLLTILILLATYTANLTASLTLGSSVSPITQVNQLQSKNVLATIDAAGVLNKFYSVNATSINLNSDDAWKTVQQALANNSYDAFVGRLSDIDYYRHQFDSACRLAVAADTRGYRTTNMAAMFHSLVPKNIVTQFGVALWTQRDNSQLYKLQSSQLLLGNTTCPVKDPSVVPPQPVKLDQLLGLWIILGIGFAAALLQAGWMVIKFARSTMDEAKITGNTDMTFSRAVSTMIVKDAPEEDTDLPPEMRTHKIKSALHEIMLRRTATNSMRGSNSGHGGGSGHGSVRGGGNSQSCVSRGGGNSQSGAPVTERNPTRMNKVKSSSDAVPGVDVDTPWTGGIATAPDRTNKSGPDVTTFGSGSLDAVAPPTLDVAPAPATFVQVFKEENAADLAAPRTIGPASPTLEGNLDMREEEVVEL